MVHDAGESLRLITAEIARWRDILAVPYQEYVLSRWGTGVTLPHIPDLTELALHAQYAPYSLLAQSRLSSAQC